MKWAFLIGLVVGGVLASECWAQTGGCARGGMQSPGLGSSMMSPLGTGSLNPALQQAQLAYQYQAQLAYLQQQTQLQQAYLQQEKELAAKKQETRDRKIAERRERKESEKRAAGGQGEPGPAKERGHKSGLAEIARCRGWGRLPRPDSDAGLSTSFARLSGKRAGRMPLEFAAGSCREAVRCDLFLCRGGLMRHAAAAVFGRWLACPWRVILMPRFVSFAQRYPGRMAPMRFLFTFFALAAVLNAIGLARAEDLKRETFDSAGFVSIFDGKSLAGWHVERQDRTQRREQAQIGRSLGRRGRRHYRQPGHSRQRRHHPHRQALRQLRGRRSK